MLSCNNFIYFYINNLSNEYIVQVIACVKLYNCKYYDIINKRYSKNSIFYALFILIILKLSNKGNENMKTYIY